MQFFNVPARSYRPALNNPMPPTVGAVDSFRWRCSRLSSRPWTRALGATYLAAVCYAAPLLTAAGDALAQSRATVIFEQHTVASEVQNFFADWQSLGASPVMELPFINGAVLSLPVGLSAADLADDPIVDIVSGDHSGELAAIELAAEGASSEGASSQSYYTGIEKLPRGWWKWYRPWGVLELYGHGYDPNVFMDDFWGASQLISSAQVHSGKVKIAVFDTGIDLSHDQLASQIKGGVDIIGMTPGIPADDNGHGTHVAGTLVAEQYGLANRSELFAVKILYDDGSGDISALLMGLQWALDNDIDVVNMSVGFRQDNPLVRAAVAQAHAAGLVMVAAVGNRSNWEDDGLSAEGASAEGASAEGASAEGASAEGASAEGASAEGASAEGASAEGASAEGASAEGASTETCSMISVSSEGASAEGASTVTCTTKTPYSVMFPAAYPEVIAVTAMDAWGEIAEFSNLGTEIDLVAPGVNIVSTVLNNGYGLASGTSMATPHVTASIALMLSVARKNNIELNPAEIRDLLIATSIDGAIDLDHALNEIINPDSATQDSHKYWW